MSLPANHIAQLFSSDAAKIVVPATATIATAIIGTALLWAKEMTASARRVRQLDEATKRVEFWNSWASALEHVRAPFLDRETKLKAEINDRLRAEVEIRKASDRLAASYLLVDSDFKWTASSFKQYKAKVGRFRRLFLLYRQPDLTARKYRGLAYFVPVFALSELWVLSRLHIFNPHIPNKGDAHFWGMVVIVMLGAWYCRSRALRAEQSHFRNKLDSYASG